MHRTFRTVDPERARDLQVRVGDPLPEGHLAYFIADAVRQLDLASLVATYGTRGAPPYAPEVLLSLLCYGYATGTFSSRALELATRESLPFLFLAGGSTPDHDTFAAFRRRVLPLLPDLFTQVLLFAHTAGVFQLGNLSMDGTKIQANASKSKAVSAARLDELTTQLRQEVDELLARVAQVEAGQADAGQVPPGLQLPAEIARRETYLARLAAAKAVLETRAAARYTDEKAQYDRKMIDRAAKEATLGRPLGGKPPTPPTAGVRPTDQYNFTDPESRISKNSRDQGFNQHYNGQVAVDQTSRLVVATSLSNQANDQGTVGATLAALQALPTTLGRSERVVLDPG